MDSPPKDLPIAAYRDTIIKTVRKNTVTVIVGATGSGKTTQTPVFLLQEGLDRNLRIGVTQPRRIAAISVAEYVAGRLGCNIGKTVGYQIRFDDRTTDDTRLKFMTDGILLEEAKSDPWFSDYSVLIFDEAHERGLNTDFALGLAKRALSQRTDLKVVVMSATIDPEKFSRFFGGAPIVHVEGSMYPVDIRYLTNSDYGRVSNIHRGSAQKIARLAAEKVREIHTCEGAGDVLVFMPRKKEISLTISAIEDLKLQNLHLLEAHGDMSPDEQRRIFDRFPGRKVVVATNIAETSITIDGIVYVVDSGLINQSDFNPVSGIGSLNVVEHSYAGLEQRRGRAGRTRPGVCYCLFTKEEARTGRRDFLPLRHGSWTRPAFTKPEVQRRDLAGVVLRLMAMDVDNPEGFEFIDQPDRETIRRAYETLRAVGALTENKAITPIGWRLLKFPVEPIIGRMIIAAETYGCVDEIATIAASLSVRNIFLRPKEKEDEADEQKRQFVDIRSDFLTTLHVVDQFLQHNRDQQWAKEQFLNWRVLEELLNIHEQLLEIIERVGMKRNSVRYRKPKNFSALSENERQQGTAIGKAVTAGLIQNVAVGTGFGEYDYGKGWAYIHPGSVVAERRFRRVLSPDLIVYSEIVQTTKPFARGCQEIEFSWLEEVAPHLTSIETTEPKRSGRKSRFISYKRQIFNGRILSEERINVPKSARRRRQRRS